MSWASASTASSHQRRGWAEWSTGAVGREIGTEAVEVSEVIEEAGSFTNELVGWHIIICVRSDGQATRERILVAARAEFAAHGLAGARVDRIAASANASKERLYAYFGDKIALFGAVIELNTDEVRAAVPLDASDLPSFVGRVYDHATSHPEHLRMLDWARLERQLIASASHEPLWRSPPEIAAIKEAQRAGTIDAGWNPQELLTLLLSLATAWVHAPVDIDELNGRLNAETVARRRTAAVDAARKLLS